MVSMDSAAGSCASWKMRTFSMARSSAAICFGRQRAARGGELRRTHRQVSDLDAIESFRCTREAPRRPSRRTVSTMSRTLLEDFRTLLLRGARQRGALAFGIQLVPLDDAHGQASIFSTGSTRRALAPAFFRLSSVSQNTFSRHTAWIATLSGWPSSGMMVGDSLPGSSRRISGKRRARRVQHDVLALAHLLHALDAHQQALDPLILLGREVERRADDGGAAFQHGLHFAQVIGLQRRAGGDQIADEVGAPEARRDFHRAGQRHDLRLHVPLRADSSRACTDRWWQCACREARRSLRMTRPSGTASERRQRPKSSVRICWKRARGTVCLELQALLLQHVEPDEAEVADILLHEVRDVVIAHEQHIERHVLAVRHELVLAARDLEATAQQQVERRVGEPSRTSARRA